MKFNIQLTVFSLIVSTVLTAQTTDLARVEYLYLPFSKSDNSISRYRILAQVPLVVNKEKKNYFVVSAEYRFVDININDPEDVSVFEGFNLATSEVTDNMVNSVQRIDLSLAYTWTTEYDWRFGVRAGTKIQSDFNGGLISEDFIYEVGIYVVKDMRDKSVEDPTPHRLIIGLRYSTVPGRWYPLPLINYHKMFKPNWTYTLGVPKTNLRYYLNDTHKDALQVFATIDNIYSNLQQNFIPTTIENPKNAAASSIQQTIVLLGLGYEHFFTENLVFYAYAEHSVYNDFRLEDKKGNKVYKINTENSAYFRTGLKFKF